MPLKILLHIKRKQLWNVWVQPRFNLRKYILFHWSAWEKQTEAQSVIKLFKHRCQLAKNNTDSSDQHSDARFILLCVCASHIVLMGLLSPVYEMWPISLPCLRVALKIERNIYLPAMRQVEEFFASLSPNKFYMYLGTESENPRSQKNTCHSLLYHGGSKYGHSNILHYFRKYAWARKKYKRFGC